MKTTTKILCILGLVASSVGLIVFSSWKKEFALEYPIPEGVDLTYGDIYVLNLISQHYPDDPQPAIKYSENKRCYFERLKKMGYIDAQNHITESTVLERIPNQTKILGRVFEYGNIIVDPRSFAYQWSEDLTKRGFYTSDYYLDGLPMQKIYYRTFKAKLAEFAFDVC